MMSDKASQNFVDYVEIQVKAGDGGHGCINFRREKYVAFGGPDGGDGGRGGSIFLVADDEMTTLLDLRYRRSYRAQDGANGDKKNMSGKSGEDITLKVPLGTIISDANTGEVIGEILASGQKMEIARGGDGGRGNQHFATPTNRAPRKAESGWPGTERRLILELKVLADAGLVGLPNAGKSTLLAAMTSATPKIAPYPFTTLHPNLGVFMSSNYQRRIVLADIPGLIEGAHQGIGLGDRFLRHIERTAVLVHLVAPESGTTEDGTLTQSNADPETLLYAYDLIREELAQYSQLLPKKPTLVCLSKIDLLSEEEINSAISAFGERGIELLPISAESSAGLDDLRHRIEAMVTTSDTTKVAEQLADSANPYHPPKRLFKEEE